VIADLLALLRRRGSRKLEHIHDNALTIVTVAAYHQNLMAQLLKRPRDKTVRGKMRRNASLWRKEHINRLFGINCG
jgi:hypothetical protein